MLKAFLFRFHKTNTLTLGYLCIGGKVFATLEQPWQNNERNVSCIPPQSYRTTHLPKSGSGKYVDVFHVQPVPDRLGILIHNGNIVTHTKGCILLGLSFGNIGQEVAVLNSRSAMRQLNLVTSKQGFALEIM